MNGSISEDKGKCGEIRELIVWYPGGSLGKAERDRVEEHVAVCGECSDFLEEVTSFSETIQRECILHPDAGDLVLFVEDSDALGDELREYIEKHITVCGECSEQVAMLEEVEKDLDTEDMAEPSVLEKTHPEALGERKSFISLLNDLWKSFSSGIFRPIPAAVYFIIAVIAVAILFSRSDRMTGPTGGEPGDRAAGRLGGAVILNDEGGRARDIGEQGTVAARIEGVKDNFILLELVGLQAPPVEDAIYTVVIESSYSEEAAFISEVHGRDFTDNYTIVLLLHAGALNSGTYEVKVLGPDEEALYISSIEVE